MADETIIVVPCLDTSNKNQDANENLDTVENKESQWFGKERLLSQRNVQLAKKIIGVGCFTMLNAVLIALVMRVPFWSYVWLLSISNLVRCICIISLCYSWLRNMRKPPIAVDISTKSSVFVLPCYNESESEIGRTLESILNASEMVPTIVVVIVDGRATGVDNSEPTYIICEKLLNVLHIPQSPFTYSGWKGHDYFVNVKSGYCPNSLKTPFLLIEKQENFGKKDSLILIRELILQFNGGRNRNLGAFGDWFKREMESFGILKVDYIFGTDADTIISPNSIQVMLEKMESNPMLIGLSGNVRIDLSINNPLNYWVAYQVFEYMCINTTKFRWAIIDTGFSRRVWQGDLFARLHSNI